MGNRIQTVNIKRDMPTVGEARQRLKEVLIAAKRDKVAVIKLIHGYGSSGVGGALRDALRKSLRLRVKDRLIAGFIPGESWSIFDPHVRRLQDLYPELARDSDLTSQNPGMTVILMDSQAGEPRQNPSSGCRG